VFRGRYCLVLEGGVEWWEVGQGQGGHEVNANATARFDTQTGGVGCSGANIVLCERAGVNGGRWGRARGVVRQTPLQQHASAHRQVGELGGYFGGSQGASGRRVIWGEGGEGGGGWGAHGGGGKLPVAKWTQQQWQ
jgi:hypothetical protein